VVLTTVKSASISPSLFGIGTIEARYTYKIGPTFAGRVLSLAVDVGDRVKAGQTLGEMDPVDLDERIRAQSAALKRSQAQLVEAQSRTTFARSQDRRYEELGKANSVSEEVVSTKRQELKIAEAGLTASEEELARLKAEGDALTAQRENLHLKAPVDGLVVVRNAEPGTTVVAGQAVVEVIDPTSLWVNVRFDQIHAQGLAADLPAKIELRSQGGEIQSGHVFRVEPLADAVTEETLGKVVFEKALENLPPLGELAQVTVLLPPLPEGPVVPNAAIQRRNGDVGVWKVSGDELEFVPVRVGVTDLEGRAQVREGVSVGDRVVHYSTKALHDSSSISVVDRLPGVKK
jgi:RND family efflux transporter MFP subunit